VIVDETGWGANFSQLVADGIVAEKLPAGTPPGPAATGGGNIGGLTGARCR
jgi:hypothetical protein